MTQAQQEKEANLNYLFEKIETSYNDFQDQYQQKQVLDKQKEEELQVKVGEMVIHECTLLKETFNDQMKQNEEMLIRLQIKKPISDENS